LKMNSGIINQLKGKVVCGKYVLSKRVGGG
jgi:hypothetical protein